MDFQHADSDAAKSATEFFRQRMREHIKDERLLQGMASPIVFPWAGVANEVQVSLLRGVWAVDALRLQTRICEPSSSQTSMSTSLLRKS